VNYIGGHPLAGSEGCGPDAAGKGKFAGTTFVLIPLPGTEPRWIELIEELVTSLEARPLTMASEQHDQLIAVTSSLPYLLAIALAQLASTYAREHAELWDLVGGSFRSATRVATSSPDMTLDMFLTNRTNIVRAASEMINELSRLSRFIDEGDEASLRALIEKAKSEMEVIQNG
jgi:prephenate dehydrogenase